MLQEKMIMVVDDYYFVSEMILKQTGVCNEIIIASDGLEALTKLRGIAANGAHLPALIFLDLKIPVMDGRSAAAV